MKKNISEIEKLDNKENKAKEKALEYKKRYLTLFDKMLNGFALCKLLTDKGGNPIDYIFLEVNRAFEKINSMNKEEVINKKVSEVFGFKVIPDLEKYFQVALQGKKKVFETYIPRYDKYFKVVSYSPRRGYFVTIFEDITQRKKAEENIRELNKKLNLSLEERNRELIKEQNYTNYLLENSPDVQVTLNTKGKIVEANRACEEILGKNKKELIGSSIYKDLPEDKIKKVIDRVLKEKQVRDIEITINVPEKEPLIYDFSGVVYTNFRGKLTSIYLSGRDITERKKLQRNLIELSENLEKKVMERTKELKEARGQLIQSEKLSIIGELAAGVAHEVRNPLATISLIAQHLEKKVTDNYQIEKLKAIQRNIDRIDKIFYGLLNFSHPPRSNFAYHNVNEILDRLSFLENLSSENIKIIKKYETKLPQAWFNSDRLEQVFLNLIFNAMRAMKNGGKLYITTSFDSTRKGIIIKFEDTGAGISEENLKKIFNPFFTTYQEGTGLGLSICQNIINEHKGNISVESKLGKGTAFTIFLPLEKRKEKKQAVDGI